MASLGGAPLLKFLDPPLIFPRGANLDSATSEEKQKYWILASTKIRDHRSRFRALSNE
jgi:hypothetical protein